MAYFFLPPGHFLLFLMQKVCLVLFLFFCQSHRSQFNLYFSFISAGKSLSQDCRTLYLHNPGARRPNMQFPRRCWCVLVPRPRGSVVQPICALGAGGSPGLGSVPCSGSSFRVTCRSSVTPHCAAVTQVAMASKRCVWASQCNEVLSWLPVFCHPEVPRLSLSELGRDYLFGHQQVPLLCAKPPKSLRYN